MAASESRDEARNVRLTLQRECSQMQASDPPFRALLQCDNRLLWQLEIHCLIEKSGSFASIEAQVSRVEFGKLIASA